MSKIISAVALYLIMVLWGATALLNYGITRSQGTLDKPVGRQMMLKDTVELAVIVFEKTI